MERAGRLSRDHQSPQNNLFLRMYTPIETILSPLKKGRLASQVLVNILLYLLRLQKNLLTTVHYTFVCLHPFIIFRSTRPGPPSQLILHREVLRIFFAWSLLLSFFYPIMRSYHPDQTSNKDQFFKTALAFPSNRPYTPSII